MNVKTVYLEPSVLGSLAAATCYGDDYLVSWNHRHLTRPLKRLQYEAVNRLHGYLKTPLICNPLEVLDELRD